MINTSRAKAYYAVNTEMLNLHWKIGKRIMDVQEGKSRAKYGNEVLEKLSEMLTNEFGKGFSVQNLRRMRQFYMCFPIRSTVLSELSWSHYLEIIKTSKDLIKDQLVLEFLDIKENTDYLESDLEKSILYI